MNFIRLNKFISSSGFCSRREADKLIDLGRVFVNGKPCKPGTQVTLTDSIEIDGQLIKGQTPKEFIYLVLNKPTGITCTTDSNTKGNIIDFINYPEKIFPIGRLDKFSQGLIFLTNNGDIVNKILRSGNSHEKEYIVSVDKPVTDYFIKKMSNGLPILNTVTQKCIVNKVSKNSFKIILTQGLNRQIRRMCELLDYRVTFLQRTRIMNVSLGRLKIGSWRHLTSSEINEINNLLSNSSKTQDASFDFNKNHHSKNFKRKGPNSNKKVNYRRNKRF